MSIEAIETEVPATVEVDTQGVPETPIETDVPEVTPESAPEVAGPSDIEQYQDLLAKASKDTEYEMSNEELEMFDSVQEKIQNGEIPEPGLKEDKPAEDPKPEIKPEIADTETPSETADVLDALSMEKGDSLQDAMTKVGAKDLSELPGKIDGLLNGMRDSGGKLGNQNTKLQAEVDANTNFMQALGAKDPGAIAHFKKVTGIDISAPVPVTKEQAAPAAATADFDPDSFLDDKLAPVVKGLMDKIEALEANNKSLVANDESRAQTAAQTAAETAEAQAREAWTEDVVELVTDYADDFGLNPSEARALAKFYWSKEGAKTAVHPRFQKVHKLIAYAGDNDMPNLETAHLMLQKKTGVHAQKLIDAEKRGQQANQHTESPNLAISAKQGRTKSTNPTPQVTEDMIEAMKGGDLNAIPDSVLNEWTDEDYNFDKSKIPERFHKAVFGGETY